MEIKITKDNFEAEVVKGYVQKEDLNAFVSANI